MSLSIDKCHCITFSRSKAPIIFDYTIGNISLDRVDRITDLGVVMDSRMSFIPHINEIVSVFY